MKVLIVDDENIVRLSLKRAFENFGHQVEEAADGLSGLELWRRYDPDLAMVDVLMPRLTGPNLLKELGADRRAKVILISAHTGEFNPTKAQSVGADLFIPKPFDNIFEVVKLAEGLVNAR